MNLRQSNRHRPVTGLYGDHRTSLPVVPESALYLVYQQKYRCQLQKQYTTQNTLDEFLHLWNGLVSSWTRKNMMSSMKSSPKVCRRSHRYLIRDENLAGLQGTACERLDFTASTIWDRGVFADRGSPCVHKKFLQVLTKTYYRCSTNWQLRLITRTKQRKIREATRICIICWTLQNIRTGIRKNFFVRITVRI